MNFKTITEAFNYWNQKTIAEIDARTAEIRSDVEKNPAADLEAHKIELAGLKQAKENLQGKADNAADQRGFNPITGMNFETRASQEAISGDVYASAEYRSAFFKTLLGQSLNQVEQAAFTRAQAENRSDEFNTVTNSAAVVPTTTLNEIVKKARTMGGIIGHCRSFNMPTKIAIPVATPGTAAAWHTEGAAVETEKNVPVTVTFGAYEIIKIFSISAAAKKMTIAAFESYLTEELAACVMETIENSLINGTGSNQGTGILNTNGVKEVTFTDPIAYVDVVGIVASIKRGYSAGAVWAMNNATLYNTFYSMVDANGRPLFISDPKAEEIGKILGHEVVVDDHIADDTFIFGNFNYMGYNLPSGIALEKSTESSFRSGLVDYRAMAVADTKCIVPEAFVVAKKATA